MGFETGKTHCDGREWVSGEARSTHCTLLINHQQSPKPSDMKGDASNNRNSWRLERSQHSDCVWHRATRQKITFSVTDYMLCNSPSIHLTYSERAEKLSCSVHKAWGTVEARKCILGPKDQTQEAPWLPATQTTPEQLTNSRVGSLTHLWVCTDDD